MELAILLARRARRTAVIQAIRSRPDLTLEQLEQLFEASRYGDELAGVTVHELWSFEAPACALIGPRPGETVETAVMRVFRELPGRELASGFFCRFMGLERWTAQKLLADLAVRGLLVRQGKTSSTRYGLPATVRENAA